MPIPEVLNNDLAVIATCLPPMAWAAVAALRAILNYATERSYIKLVSRALEKDPEVAERMLETVVLAKVKASQKKFLKRRPGKERPIESVPRISA